MSEFKECIICNNIPEDFHNDSYYDCHTVRCTTCDYEIDFANKEIALYDWNSRVVFKEFMRNQYSKVGIIGMSKE